MTVDKDDRGGSPQRVGADRAGKGVLARLADR